MLRNVIVSNSLGRQFTQYLATAAQHDQLACLMKTAEISQNILKYTKMAEERTST